MALRKIAENIWQIDQEGKMLVPGIIFASDKLMEKIKEDKTIEQAKNMASMPGVVEKIVILPDAHQGYGACMGGVAAYDSEKGVISPGEIGYDINCSVRLIKTNLTKKEFLKKRSEVLHEISRSVPTGTGRSNSIKLDDKDLNNVLNNGMKWCLDNGYATSDDITKTEDNGLIKGADSSKVSNKAKSRGRDQLGTLGSGNHFLEIQEVETIFDKGTAKIFGLEKDQIVIMIHCGSRGLGHQVASDYIQLMEKEYGFKDLPDRELICAPINSKLGKDYRAAMAAAANFAFTNKQIITYNLRKVFDKFFPKSSLDIVYDVCHNIAKFEEFTINNKKQTLCVHRKGATRSFGPGRKELPPEYQKTGQPILIPGSMGTFSYVLVGTDKAKDLSFASTPHGAGRVHSRTYAINNFTYEDMNKKLTAYDVLLKAGSKKGAVEESPEAYKDVNEVVRVSDELGIGKLVARTKPLAVLKG